MALQELIQCAGPSSHQGRAEQNMKQKDGLRNSAVGEPSAGRYREQHESGDSRFGQL
jgi:hypothetical protein